MAYASLNNQNDDELNPSLSNEEGNLVSGQGAGGMAASGGNQAQPAQPQDKGGSQFPDISRYLSQNEAGGKRLASQYAGKVATQGNEARQGVTNLQNAFNTQATAIPVNETVKQQAVQAPKSFFNEPAQTQQGPNVPQPLPQTTPVFDTHNYETAQNIPYYTSQANPDPGPAGPNPAHPAYVYNPINFQSQVTAPTAPAPVANQPGFNALQAMLHAKYEGPQNLAGMSGYADTQAAVQKAAQLGPESTTDQGRRDMLRSMYGNRTVSPGVANLDNLLLQAQGPQKVLRGISDKNADIPGLLAQANTASGERAKSVTDLDAQTAQSVLAALTGRYQDFDTDYQKRLADAKAAEQMQEAITIPRHARDDHTVFNRPTNVATEDDYQILQALNQLLGSNYGL